MRRSARIVSGLAVLGLMASLDACRDPSSSDGTDTEDVTPTISEPVIAASPFAGGASGGGRILRSTMAAAGAEDPLAYIAVPPDPLRIADVAVIQSREREGSIIVAVRNGGFDPVPVAASPGDSVDIQFLRLGGGDAGLLTMRVPSKKAPKVVRSNPRGRADVPINKHIVVVFSEPIDTTSLTSATFRLRRNNTTIAGHIQYIDNPRLTFAIVPEAELARGQSYTLEVTGVRDAQGEVLEGRFRHTFTTGSTRTGPPAVIRMSIDTVRLTARTYQLNALVEDAAGNILAGQPIVWESSDPSGLSVRQDGVITALREGDYNVFARVGDVVSYTNVIATSLEPIQTITVDPPAASVIAEDTIVLTSDLRDASGRRLIVRDVTWTTSDPALATVTPGFAPNTSARVGRVVAKAPGVVTITATGGTRSASSTITITPARPVALLTLAPTSADLVPGGTVRLIAALKAADGRILTSRPIAWRSTSASVASVDATGLVTAVAAGSTDIIGTSEGVSDTVSITVGTVGQFSSVMAGWGLSCALDAGGKASCWGSLIYEAGNALPVSLATDVRFTSLTGGTWHACGLTAAGSAYCWGLNDGAEWGIDALGHLGTGSTSRVVADPSLVTGGVTFASISAGRFHTCGLTSAGVAYCWGSNSHGQLGGGQINESRTVPTPVTGGLTFASISAGMAGTCGVTTTGAGYCWGSNNGGQLGNGSAAFSSLVPVPVGGGLSFRAISTGGTLDSFGGFACGVTTAGAAYCWGDNPYGQLGSIGTSRVPVAVSGGITFSSVETGETHACGLAVSGAAYCWGRRWFGQLGDGGAMEPDVNPLPVAVSGGLSFTQLSVGGHVGHSCGLTSSGAAWCWGDGRQGQLGQGLKAISNAPVKVGEQLNDTGNAQDASDGGIGRRRSPPLRPPLPDGASSESRGGSLDRSSRPI
jgi:alpha-tubulin suppressor-like RCC1 family protein/uncharacterized protein YjdB